MFVTTAHSIAVAQPDNDAGRPAEVFPLKLKAVAGRNHMTGQVDDFHFPLCSQVARTFRRRFIISGTAR